MKKHISLILISFLFCTACENKKLTLVGNIKLDRTFPVDQTGAFSSSSQITSDQVRNDLDIPETATIEEVNIESISIKVLVLQDNQATAVRVSGKLQIGNTAPKLFNDYIAPLVLVDNPYIGLNTIIAEGIQGIRSKIEEYLKTMDNTPINITLVGDSSPTAGNRIHAQILLKINGTVKYSECINLPFFMGGEKCSQ
jgi:hypothetical protein